MYMVMGHTNEHSENALLLLYSNIFVLQISMNAPLNLVCMAAAQMVSIVTCANVMMDMMVITVIMVCTNFGMV